MATTVQIALRGCPCPGVTILKKLEKGRADSRPRAQMKRDVARSWATFWTAKQTRKVTRIRVVQGREKVEVRRVTDVAREGSVWPVSTVWEGKETWDRLAGVSFLMDNKPSPLEFESGTYSEKHTNKLHQIIKKSISSIPMRRDAQKKKEADSRPNQTHN